MLTFNDLTHTQQDLYWHTALRSALEEAQVPEGTLSRAQIGTIVTSLVISRQLESEGHLMAVVAAGSMAGGGKTPSKVTVTPRAEVTVTTTPSAPIPLPTYSAPCRIGIPPRHYSLPQ